jgi:hypothetical protein
MTVLSPAQNGHAAKTIGFEAPGAATTTSTFCAPACGTIALANNAEGAIVGYYTDPNVVPHGFVRSPDGHILSFDAPGADLGADLNQGTAAYSINDWGLIAGEFEDSSNVFHGFLRYPDGSFTTFDAPGAGRAAFLGTQSFDVNVEGASAGIYFETMARNTDLFAPAMARLRRLIRRVRLAPWFARKPALALRAKSQDPITTRPASLTVLYAIQAGRSGPSTRPEQELAQAKARSLRGCSHRLVYRR